MNVSRAISINTYDDKNMKEQEEWREGALGWGRMNGEWQAIGDGE
jgi:hypothetical protein